MSAEKDSIHIDEYLIAMLANNKEKAFNAIYDLYWEKLYLYIFKVIKDDEAAQDITQEILVSLWLRSEKLTGVKSLSAYLFTAAKYKSFTYIRDNLQKNNYEQSLTDFISVYDNSLVENFEAKELDNIINKEIENLPSKMKEVYVLSRKENLSHKEISEKLAISDKTVKKQIGNALKLFRIKLNNTYIYLIIIALLLE